TLLRELFEEVSRHEVGMDVLTKLLNRRFLPTIFKREIAHANRTGTPLSVLIIDVDKFKEINDTWGHNTGDEILRKVSFLSQKRLVKSKILGAGSSRKLAVS
ncbi:TPA: diguanylate cyclase DosC, partial [Shigella flexneri]